MDYQALADRFAITYIHNFYTAIDGLARSIVFDALEELTTLYPHMEQEFELLRIADETLRDNLFVIAGMASGNMKDSINYYLYEGEIHEREDLVNAAETLAFVNAKILNPGSAKSLFPEGNLPRGVDGALQERGLENLSRAFRASLPIEDRTLLLSLTFLASLRDNVTGMHDDKLIHTLDELAAEKHLSCETLCNAHRANTFISLFSSAVSGWKATTPTMEQKIIHIPGIKGREIVDGANAFARAASRTFGWSGGETGPGLESLRPAQENSPELYNHLKKQGLHGLASLAVVVL